MSQPKPIVLGIDIDSTIWPAENEYDTACLELHGRPFGAPNHWYDIPELIENFGEEYWRIFELALHHSKIKDRSLYPGAAKAMGEIHEMGVGIHFISKTYHPDKMREPLRKWLSEHLSFEFGLSLTTTEDKLHLLRRIEAVGMVDDRPDLAKRVIDSGMWCAVREQPWNQEFLKDNPEVRKFKRWHRVPDMIRQDVLGKGGTTLAAMGAGAL